MAEARAATPADAERLIDPPLLMAGMFAIAMLPLLAAPVLPLIDFYNHLARFFVLAHLSESATLQSHYVAHWALLPDVGVDVVGTPLLVFLPPLAAGHVIAVLLLANLYAGALYFHRRLTGRSSLLVAVLLLPLLYSYVLNWGFANFLLGLGLAFWAAGWWLKHRADVTRVVIGSSVWSLLIFFCHGIAFMLYGVLVALLEVGFFLESGQRSPRLLMRRLLLVSAQAVLPVIYFLFWKFGLAAGGEVSALADNTPPPFFERLSRALTYHLKTVLRVEESPYRLLDFVTLAVQAGAVGFLLFTRRLKLAAPAWRLVAVVLVLALLPLPTLFGVGYIADRVPLFAALCFLAALTPGEKSWNGIGRGLALLLIAIVGLRLCAIAVGWLPYAQTYQEFRAIAAELPQGSLTQTVMVGNGRHETNVPRCEMYGPLLVALYGQAAPLFADEKQQPLAMTGRLRQAVGEGRVQPVLDPRTQDYDGMIRRAFARGFDHVLVCNAGLLGGPYPRGVEVVARTPQFALLRAAR
ncbi:MAG TPA: hypothetical protein VN723_08060 [Rhizomicrobium sp.]|nr:hypothetical protein [Rhizomicrobium sp.]